MRNLHRGDHGPDVARLQRAINRRLKARSAGSHAVKEDGQFGEKTKAAMVQACFLLGMKRDQLDKIRSNGAWPAAQDFVFHPGRRGPAEKASGQRRVKRYRTVLKRRHAEAASANSKRRRIVDEAKKAAANYRKNPGAYHYLAGGLANTEYLHPTPRDWRSDCSQFAASVYKGAGLPSPAQPLPHEWASTYSIVKAHGARVVDRAHRKPGMLGMYGSVSAPHHVEIWCGDTFVGHGSPPIDTLTPGEPNYYIDFDFLN